MNTLSKTVVKDTINDLMGRYGMDSKKTLIDVLRMLDKISNGTINNPIAEVSMARKRGEDVSKILTPGDMYRKQFGECFTPIKLVNEMLDKLPVEVWSKKDYKWLDNSVGGGNFPVEVFKRLMVGLAAVITDEEARRKHILEKMLYFVDMQTKNVFFTIQRLGEGADYEFNYHVGDSLKFDYWGGMKFDVVVGNPPYKKGIDLKFLDMFITQLEAKYIVIVHPSTYLIDTKDNDRYNKIKKLLASRLRSVDLFNGNPVFGVGLFVPCVIINYDRDYNGTCAVEYFDQKFDSDVWNITKFGKEWFDIVKPFMDKIGKVCANDNDVWSRCLHKKHTIDSSKYYCQFAAILGDSFYRGDIKGPSEKFDKNIPQVKENFYTLSIKDKEKNKGVRITMDKPGGTMPTFEFDRERDRDNFIEYCNTFFTRFCLSLLKNGQHTENGEMSLIPWLDFTQPWDDAKLFKHFNIDQKTQDYIYKFLPDYYGIR